MRHLLILMTLYFVQSVAVAQPDYWSSPGDIGAGTKLVLNKPLNIAAKQTSALLEGSGEHHLHKCEIGFLGMIPVNFERQVSGSLTVVNSELTKWPYGTFPFQDYDVHVVYLTTDTGNSVSLFCLGHGGVSFGEIYYGQMIEVLSDNGITIK